MLIAPTLPPAYEEDEQPATTTTATTTTTSTESSTVANSLKPSQALVAPATPAAVPHVDYSSEEPVIESIGQAAALSASHALLDTNNQQAEEDASVDASTADKNDVHLQAAKLLIAGVKQTSHDQAAVLRTNRVTLGRPPVSSSSSTSTTSTTATTTTVRTTPAMLTSTETVTEISSTQERIRGYRRFAQKRVGGNAATLRRQAQLPRGTKPTSSSRGTTTTTPRSTTATRSYQERLAASRLRLSRLSLATKPTTTSTATTTASSSTTAATSRATTTSNTRTTASPLSPVRAGAEQSPNRKLSVRNIDRETGQQRASWDSVQSSLQRFQVQRGNRVYTPATRASSSSSRSTTPSSSSTTTSRPAISSTQSPHRGRNRHVVSYRTQAPQQQQRTRGTTTPRSTTTTTQRTTAAAALSTLTQQISAIASGYSYTPAPPNPLNTYTSAATAQTLQQQQLTQQQLPSSSLSSQQLQSTSSLSPSSAFLPFDKLTRAIVDESILQNFKSSNAQRGSTASNSQQQRQQQQQRVAKPATASSSNNYNYPKPTAPGKHSSNFQHSN